MSITEVKLSVDTLSIPELEREIGKHYQISEEIGTKAQARGGMSAEESQRFGEALQAVDSLEAVLTRKQGDEANLARMRQKMQERRGPANPMIHAEPQREDRVIEQRMGARKTIGQMFVESAEYKASFPKGQIHSQNMVPRIAQTFEGYTLREHKTLLQGAASPGGGPLVQNDVQMAVRDDRRPLTFLDLITRLTTDSDTIEWPSEAFTNAAATVAEATATTGTSGTKAESALTYTTNTSAVQTIAHWIPVTTRMLADYSGIQGLINASLMLGLDETLETQILTGDGSSPNLDGLTHLTSVLTQALGSDSTVDAVFKAMVKVQVTGYAMPTGVVLNPLNFQTVRLARENAATGTLGGYLYGPPSMSGPMTMWGLPVVQAIGLTANTALVGDFSARRMVLWDREQTTLRTGYIDQQFVRNMLTVLAELRAAFTVFRQVAVCKITGLS